MEHIRQVAVIGAGLMGHGIAQVFAMAGHPVTLVDTAPEPLSQALPRVRANLTRMAEYGLVQKAEIEPALARISTTTTLAKAAQADFVVEAVLEEVKLKQRLFAELDALCPKSTILATNTSVISITEIASASVRRERIVGTHFWNPPYLVPLVEVVRGNETSEATMKVTLALLAAVGKHPVRVQKDVPGFVGNRLQHALWREAVSIVERGIADADAVDEVVKFGFGMRLPVLGPLENAELVGLDLTLAIHDYLLRHLESAPEPAALLRRKVAEGDLGFKSGKGFREWDDEGRERVRAGLEAHLMQWVKPRGSRAAD